MFLCVYSVSEVFKKNHEDCKLNQPAHLRLVRTCSLVSPLTAVFWNHLSALNYTDVAFYPRFLQSYMRGTTRHASDKKNEVIKGDAKSFYAEPISES